jgi:hypothetical protein
MSSPGYWMNEIGGLLREVVEAYLKGLPLTEDDVGMMRDYLRQWVESDMWTEGPELDTLRKHVKRIKTREDIDACVWEAVDLGMDPL